MEEATATGELAITQRLPREEILWNKWSSCKIIVVLGICSNSYKMDFLVIFQCVFPQLWICSSFFSFLVQQVK